MCLAGCASLLTGAHDHVGRVVEHQLGQVLVKLLALLRARQLREALLVGREAVVVRRDAGLLCAF